ncbi:MAG: hypothetical protein JRI23_33710 [Deltaproteobacteria bacterium]|nr:hypothetical protein [Deltaproteobacteria bacterium]MBW2537239.1 hypothetical protein [Deltaproteobacteria bacterium]
MEAFLGAIISIVIAVGAMAGFVVPVVAIVWWANQQQKRRHSTWAEAAAQLGLAYGGGRIHGRRYGHPVQVSTVTRGSGNNRSTYTVVSSRLETPLDLGLSVRRHGFFSNLLHGSHDIPFNDPTFDRAFIVQADEDHRAHRLLTPALRRLLLDHVGRSQTFLLSDRGMVVERPGTVSDPRWLHWAVELCSRAAYQLDQARSQVPAATPLLGHRHAWAAYATANGLRGLDTPLCMWGKLDGSEVVVFAARTGTLAYALSIQLKFPRPLGLGLVLEPQGTLDRLAIFFGSQDHRLGDADFDQAFVVKVSDADRVATVLDAPVRAQLLGLHNSVGPVSLDDHGLMVRLPFVPRDPSAVPRTVHQLTGVTEAITSRSPADAQVGPYR